MNIKKLNKVILLIIILSIVFFNGCSFGPNQISIFVVSTPKKIVYNLNEEINLDGLKIEGYNSDGTTKMISVNNSNISNQVDMSTFGEKTVVITKNNLSTSFKIYIPQHFVNTNDNIKQTIVSAKDNDIICLKQGEYKPSNNEDTKYYNIVVNKPLTFVGENMNTTIFSGNFLVGVEDSNSLKKIQDFEKVNFININFKLDYNINNNFINYVGPYGSSDLNGAIKTFDTNKVTVKNCIFDGFAYAINSDNISGLSVIKNTFKNLRLCAINITQNAKNTNIYKNTFMDIAENSAFAQDDGQGFVSAIKISLNKEENLGIIISNNTFTRIGLKTDSLIYYNDQAKQINQSIVFNNANYIFNSAIIIFNSPEKNNLEVSGIILSFNNFGNTLNNILFGTNENDFINHTAVIINNN